MKIAITCHYASLPEDHPTWKRAIEAAEVVLSEKVNLSKEELWDFVSDADALISGTDFIKEDVIAELPDCLKVISRPAVGYDRVDIKAARARGIDVCNAPGTNSNAVAELAMGLMLCCARTLPYHFANTKQKLWKNDRNGMELTGKTLGILGLGAIGKELAKKAASDYPALKFPEEKPEQPSFDRKVRKNPGIRQKGRVKLKTMGCDAVMIGHETIDLRYVEQLVDSEQLNTLGQIVRFLEEEIFDGRKTLGQAIEQVENVLDKKGLAGVCEGNTVPGNLARPRIQEIYACMNRYRKLGTDRKERG